MYRHLDNLQCHRLHLCLQAVGQSCVTVTPVRRHICICSALTIQMGKALDNKNLGRWASLMHERLPTSHVYLPYETHKALREVRRLSFVLVWRVAITPPHYLIYAIYHIRLGMLYIGVTNTVPVRRLRKHMTDAMAGVENASLHRIMLTVDMAGWGRAVLEYVDNEWWLGVRERDWWFTLKRWAVNHVAPGVGQGPN